MFFETAGSTQVTADTAIGSGRPVRVYQATWLSDGTARDLELRSGAADTAAIWVKAAGVISKTTTITFGEHGLLFPSGCFIDIGSSVSVNITYRVEK